MNSKVWFVVRENSFGNIALILIAICGLLSREDKLRQAGLMKNPLIKTMRI